MLYQIEIKTILKMVNIVLIILLAYVSADLVSLFLEQSLDSKVVRVNSLEAAPVSLEREKPLSFYNKILTRNLLNSKESIQTVFDEGSLPQVAETNVEENTQLSTTTLSDLYLRGTIATRDDDAMAVFEQRNNKRQFVVRIHEQIGMGIFLEDVLLEKVIILNNGVREEMALYREQNNSVAANMRSSISHDGIEKKSGNSYHISKDTLDKTLQDVNAVITQIAMRPKMEDGACVGYEVRRIKDGSIFEDIGLQKGDVLQTVNGMNLSNPEDAFRVYKSLIGETSFNIDLLRNGQTTTLNYEIR